MKHKLKYFSFILLIIAISGCKKFLNVRPSNNSSINPRSVEDFEEMLNSSTIATPNYLLADLVSDDVLLSDKVLDLPGKNAFYINAYLWAEVVWTPSDNDPIYSETYKSILQMNIILDNIYKANGGTAERKEIVAAQAKINRAYCYLQLVNLYGTDYQSSSAGVDLAVPLVLHPDGTVLPQRNTVQQVYDQILTDLHDAVNTSSLPDFGVDIIHPGKVAAFALLARTYLYMGNYESALEAAESTLRIKSTLLDYRDFSFVNSNKPLAGVKNKPFTLKNQQINPEVILARVCMDADFIDSFKETLFISNDLLNSLGNSDLRFTYGFSLDVTSQNASYIKYNDQGIESMQFNYSVGVPEIMLIKAECLARKGEDAKALSMVNQLSEYRYSKDVYKPLNTSVTMDALTLVLEERRRELFLHGGLRLFDLKRLNREERFKKNLDRISMKDGSVKASIQAGSPRYLMPFAPNIIANNRSIVQNER